MMKGRESQVLTFAELYRRRIQRSRSNSLFSRSRMNFETRENLSLTKCQQDLAEFASALENDPAGSFVKLKYLMNILPRQLEDGFMRWVDHRGLDVLQLCIVFNRPEIIDFVLENKDLFPEHYAPVLNPYAHLAATLGYKECLEMLLTHRPSFYFKSSQPHHAVKLPKDIQARLKLKEGGPSFNKHVQKMLRKVAESSLNAEKAWETPIKSRPTPETDILDREVALYKHQKPTKPNFERGIKKKSGSSMLSFDTKEAEKQKRLYSTTMRRSQEVKVAVCQPTPKKKDHVITVYRDDLLDDTEGVVRGAGPDVKIVRAQDIKEHITAPTITDVRTLNQRSRANMIGPTKTTPNEAFVAPSTENVKSVSRFNVSGNQRDTSNSAAGPGKVSTTALFKKVEIGVRRIKKYKDFQVVIDSRMLSFKDDKTYMNKTPLTLAAEKGHLLCVKYILQTFILRQNPMLTSDQPLTLATKARSPESIAILMTGKQSREDLQGAILTALREFFPACLTVLLSGEKKDRSQLFDGENLFHIFYSQSLNSDYRYEMMPEMTRALVTCKEDVNARGTGSSHPMYTLISCAFSIKVGKQFVHYLECLKILLAARANPHFNERREEFMTAKSRLALARPDYYSAIQCIFTSAERSTTFFEKPDWYIVIMQKFIDCIVVNDRTQRRILNDVLFNYVDRACKIGFDRRIVRSLLRYGANPDYKFEDKYAVNRFFDLMLPFLTRFEVIRAVDSMIEALLMICHAMAQLNLHEAFVMFLDEHFLMTPLQALPLTRRFCYEINRELRSPRSLVRLSGLYIWKLIGRNALNAKKLQVDREILSFILP